LVPVAISAGRSCAAKPKPVLRILYQGESLADRDVSAGINQAGFKLEGIRIRNDGETTPTSLSVGLLLSERVEVVKTELHIPRPGERGIGEVTIIGRSPPIPPIDRAWQRIEPPPGFKSHFHTGTLQVLSRGEEWVTPEFIARISDSAALPMSVVNGFVQVFYGSAAPTEARFVVR
jgi:hypothetical protein